MRPDTDLGALAAAIHLDSYEDHETPCSCPWWERDVAEAQRLITELGRLGWHIAADVSLPESTKRGREGSLDLTDFTEQVLYVVVAHGPISTDDLNRSYAGYSERLPGLFPKRSFDTPRKRLSELERAGFVEQVRRYSTGKQVTWGGYGVWRATDKGRERCPSLGEVAA